MEADNNRLAEETESLIAKMNRDFNLARVHFLEFGRAIAGLQDFILLTFEPLLETMEQHDRRRKELRRLAKERIHGRRQ